MALTMDEKQVRDYYARIGKPLPKMLQCEPGNGENESWELFCPEKKKRNKYGNHRVTVDGMRFDSKHEAERWGQLQMMLRAGEILGVIRQHPFVLPGGVVYRADFVILLHGGTYRVEDAKSSATAKDKAYRIKKKQMRECLGIEIVEV